MPQRTDMAARVVQALKREIVLGRRRPGEHLAEERIAAELGVSRGPVRQALRQLVRDGLAYTLPNGRTRVSGLSEQDLADLYRLRLQLETTAVELAAQRAGDDELAALQAIVDSLGQAENQDGTALDLELHRQVVNCAHSLPLAQLWNSLSDTIGALVAATRLEGFDPAAVLEQHREIVAALRRRDAAAASHWLSIHLLKARDLLLDHLRTTR